MNTGWSNIGMKKVRKRIASSVSKIQRVSVKKKKVEEAWRDELARGRGPERKRVEVEVPVITKLIPRMSLTTNVFLIAQAPA